MKKLIIFELIMVTLVGLVYLGDLETNLMSQVVTFSCTTIGLFAFANVVLVTAKRPCVIGMSAILATSIIAAIFAKTVTAVTIVGPAVVVAFLATVVASELRAKYWQVLMSLLTEGAIIIVLFKYGNVLLNR